MPGPMGRRNMRPTEKVEHPMKILGRVLKYIFKNFKWSYLLVLICILVSAVASLMGTLFQRQLIDDYIVPMISQTNPDFAPLASAILKIACIFAIGIVAAYLHQRINVNIGNGVLKNIRDDVFEKMQKLPIKYFDTNSHGSIMSVYTNDIETLRQLISSAIPEVFQTLITVSITLASMFAISLPLTLVSIGMVLVSVFVSAKIAKKSGGYFAKQQTNLAGVNGYIEELISGQKVVKVFCHEEKNIEQFDVLNEKLRESANNANGMANIIMPINGNLGHISYVLIAIVGAILAISGNGALTLGMIVTFLGLNKSFSRPISQLSAQINSIVMAIAGANRIFKLMDEEPEVDDGDTTLVRVEKDGDKLTETDVRTGYWAWKKPDGSLVELKGDVRFNGVDFEYRKDHKILHDIDIYAYPGQKIAFVGSTGAGKTTITNLINRFYDIQEGEILYDGIDVKSIRKSDLRRSLGIVLQDTNLFTGTVMENIRYGRLNATDEECINAAKLSNADSFIKRLPEGYNTIIKGDGSSLSQGQRQLLSITRAAVCDPPVLILDEATSSVDTKTEAYVQKGMDELMKGRTTFVIAHRLSTVKNADCIMVLEKGRIIERGSHDELIEKKGRYYRLYTGNFAEE